MEVLDLPVMTFAAVVVVGIIALIATFRRPATQETAMKKEIEKLASGLAIMEGDLRSALSRLWTH